MNHISNKQLRIIRLALIFYCLHFLVGYAYGAFIQHMGFKGSQVFTFELALVVVGQMIYEAVATIRLVQKSVWLTSLITLGFALLETFIILESTGVYRSPYIPVVLVFVFLASAFNQYFAPGIVFILIIGYLLSLAGFFTNNGGGILGGLLTIIGAIISAVCGFFVWHSYYEPREVPKSSQLDVLLKSRQQQSTIIIQSIADGVIVFDALGNINLINPAASILTGWPSAEALGIDVRLVMKLAHEDGLAIKKDDDYFTAALKNKKATTEILQVTSRDGKSTIVSLVISPIVLAQNEAAVGAVAVFRDVTDARREEQQRAEFISTASHEMRTPVAAIEGYLALALNDKVSSIDAKAREYLEKAHESTEHLGKLFQDLLTSAKAEDGRLSSHPSVIEMGEFLERLTESLRFIAEKKKLGIEFVIGNNELIDTTSANNGAHLVKPLYFTWGDPDRIREVVTNLFDNAVKYTDQGKISIGLTGNVSVVQFYIRDTGPGIPASDIPHLFQKFYRVDNTMSRTLGGTGLGLFISRKIIELYKGHIWVESEMGEGSTFFINLPRLDSRKATELKAAEAAETILPTVTSLSNP